METGQAPGRGTGTAASYLHHSALYDIQPLYTPPWQAINKTIITPASLNTGEIN